MRAEQGAREGSDQQPCMLFLGLVYPAASQVVALGFCEREQERFSARRAENEQRKTNHVRLEVVLDVV